MDNNVNINTNSITYSGDVSLKIYKNNKFYKTINTHNAGTLEFMKFIRDCVVGKTGIYGRIPFRIAPMNGDQELAGNSFSGFSETEEQNTAIVTYTFLISGLNYSSDTKITALRLISADDKVYAEVTLKSDEEITLNSSTNVYIEWKLRFNNFNNSEVTKDA